MSTLIALLLSIGFAFSPRGACQSGELLMWEDMSYRIESSETSVICGHPGSWVVVSYDDTHGEIIVTHITYTGIADYAVSVMDVRPYTE